MTSSRIASLAAVFLDILLLAASSTGQGTREDYERAEMFLPQNCSELVFNLRVAPRWIHETDRFWFITTSERGHEFLLVDPEKPSVEPAFDHGRLAETLSRASGSTTRSSRPASTAPSGP